jgi:gag-polypeptide of LTR copia-type
MVAHCHNWTWWQIKARICHRGIVKTNTSKSQFPNCTRKKALKEWRTKDLLVTSWLLNSMEPAIADICICAGSAQAIWEKIEKRFGQKNNHARIFQLQTELYQAKKQPNQTITE